MRCSCLSLPAASITCLIIEGFLLICLFPSLAISKTLEPVTGQLNNTIAAKLTAVEVTLKDNVGKVVKSKVGDCLTLPLVCIFFLTAMQDGPFRIIYCVFSTSTYSPCLLFTRTQRMRLVEQQQRRCRAPSRQHIKMRSRALCFLFLKEAASPCFSKSTTASNKAHKNVRK